MFFLATILKKSISKSITLHLDICNISVVNYYKIMLDNHLYLTHLIKKHSLNQRQQKWLKMRHPPENSFFYCVHVRVAEKGYKLTISA